MTEDPRQAQYSNHRKQWREACKRQGLLPQERKKDG